MKPMLCPSMMCINPLHLHEILPLFHETGIDLLHMDVMDGHFVPNMQLGVDYCKHLRAATDIPFDYHFMVDNPETALDWFPIKEGDYVCVHAESTQNLSHLVEKIISRGARPMVALNPATPLCAAEEVFEKLAAVLVMTVNPGYAGQALIESTLPKITELRTLLDGKGLSHVGIEVDGNVGKNIVRMQQAGANMFVLGSSRFLDTHDTAMLKERIEGFRQLLCNG